MHDSANERPRLITFSTQILRMLALLSIPGFLILVPLISILAADVFGKEALSIALRSVFFTRECILAVGVPMIAAGVFLLLVLSRDEKNFAGDPIVDFAPEFFYEQPVRDRIRIIFGILSVVAVFIVGFMAFLFFVYQH